MSSDGRGCGPLYDFYAAAREDDLAGMRAALSAMPDGSNGLDDESRGALEAAATDGDSTTAERRAARLLFGGAEPPALDGAAAAMLGRLLYWFGYVASFVLFFRVHSRRTVVERLRWAYRTVGVDVRDAETVDGVERTTFRCPYRNLGAERFGRRRVCHDVLDRVDDGYATFLARHRGLDYQRPRACAASECCYSEVAER